MFDIRLNRENIEWTNTWIENALDTDNERILLIGGSTAREIRSRLSKVLKKTIDFIGTSSLYEDPCFYNVFDSFFSNNVYKYSLIIINLGAHGTYLHSSIDKIHSKRFKNSFEKFIQYCIKKCPNIAILFVAPQVYDDNTSEYNEEMNHEICHRNKIYKEVAKKYSLKTIDVYSYIISNRDIFEYRDHVHFANEESQMALANYIADSLHYKNYKQNDINEFLKCKKKKKLLYIGHAYHNKTKSSQFIQNLFNENYEVTKFDFDPYSDSFDIFKSLNGENFDVVVLWQIMPSIGKLKELIDYKKIVFFPMYDGAPPLTDHRWYEYRDCNIINFSKTLHEKCKEYGLSSYYIQYFPKPKEITNWGDEKSLFLWQRINKINPNTVDKVIGFENINKFYHHQAPDPGHYVVAPPPQYLNKVEVSMWFDTKDDMEQHLQKSAIYFAPRHLEGIGMSFLDAMAIGRCVIAPNNPTMNEYIQNGVNGFLYDLENPKEIKIENIREIQENTAKFIQNGYKTWEANKYKILDWVESSAKLNKNNKLIEQKLIPVEIQKKKIRISITYLKKKITPTHKIYYLFGFLPVYKKKKRMK